MIWRGKLLLLLAWIASRGAAAQHTVSEQYLFQSINAERAAAGLPALAWNASLADAAHVHAVQMRSAQAISHQFPSEPDLAHRAAAAGTRFSRVAENVATSGSVVQMHMALMHSPRHRDNILDPEADAVGISVVASGAQMWGVEDFVRQVPLLSYAQQEIQVAQLLAAVGLASVRASEEARATCRRPTGFIGDRPGFVMRFTATDLDRLPQQLTRRIAQGGISSAAVGACALSGKSSFAMYNLAVVLYR